jgi:hypothetical protein
VAPESWRRSTLFTSCAKLALADFEIFGRTYGEPPAPDDTVTIADDALRRR